MSKLVFPGVGKPYRGFISELRTWLQRTASWAEKSPGAQADLQATVNVLNADIGIEPVPEGGVVIENGDPAVIANAGISVNTPAGVVDLTSVPGTPIFKLPTTHALVAPGNISVANSAGASPVASPATITAGNLIDVRLPATQAKTANGGTVPIGDATAVANGQDNGTAAIAAGVFTRVTLPTGDKILKTGVAYPVSGGSGVAAASAVTITPTIVAGVITGFVLA